MASGSVTSTTRLLVRSTSISPVGLPAMLLSLAAAEDGEESPPPNDYYVRNVNPTIRSVAVADDAIVIWLPNPGDPTTEQRIPYADWTIGRDARDYQPGVWLTIEDGTAVEIREQYVP